MEKLERILFYVFLFLIPFQLRDFWHWGGNEWNSIFFYITDGLFILILICWLARGFNPPLLKLRRARGIKKDWILLLFLAVAGASLFVSSNLDVSGYRFIKLFEFAFLFLYVKATLITNSTLARHRLEPKATAGGRMTRILQILIASGIFQSLLAIGQFLKQSSLGLGVLEAGVFSPGAPGVATFIMDNGEKIMRAYASFPHPNVLAGFSLLTIFCVYKLLIGNPKSEIRNPKQIQNSKSKISKLLLPISLFILIFALFLTFSRVAIGVFLVMSLVMFLVMLLKLSFNRLRITKLFAVFLLSIIISTAILFPFLKSRFFTISLEEQAIDLRWFYNKMAISMIKDKPFLGIGIGNFVAYSENYPAYLRAATKIVELDPSYAKASEEKIPKWIFQPVHNIYLLIAVEMGLVGLLVFLAFIIYHLFRGFRRLNLRWEVKPLTFLIIGFLILGLTDHYFWTLHSGGLIFWLSLALAKN